MYRLSVLLTALAFISSCKSEKMASNEDTSSLKASIKTPDWVKNANIYEVNIRQYTEAGTFASFQTHLPRLQKMGVKILWLMPIFPISEKKRKGTLGSYYAVSDFRKTNPAFGSDADFKRLLDEVHRRDMYMILDWVPNHTGWDHTWIENHPAYYSKGPDGQITDPINPATKESWGWTDVADLDYGNRNMRRAMLDDMLYWVNSVGIDGFRMDVAHGVPNDFWDQVDSTLGAQGRPLFMLAESEIPYHRNSGTFDMTYAWGFHHLMNDIAKGDEDADEIDDFLQDEAEEYVQGHHMYFTSNHDENSWAGTVFERMGDAHQALAVLSATLNGMPLIYGGQEEPLKRRLAFFEKDYIGWKEYSYTSFYTTLLQEKLVNQALWNGQHGGTLQRLNDSDHIYAFLREKNDDKIAVFLNLSDRVQETKIESDLAGFIEIFTGESFNHMAGDHITLGPWAYRVYRSR